MVVADTVENATVLAMTLERAVQYDIESRAIGGTEIPPAEASGLKAQYNQYFLPQMWEANLRRLRTTDPDLFERSGR